MAWAILYAPEFKRDYKKLPRDLRTQLKLKGEVFQLNPFHPLLRTHKLAGKLKGFWSFSIDFRNRVLFEFLSNNEILLLRAGDHSLYQ